MYYVDKGDIAFVGEGFVGEGQQYLGPSVERKFNQVTVKWGHSFCGTIPKDRLIWSPLACFILQALLLSK